MSQCDIFIIFMSSVASFGKEYVSGLMICPGTCLWILVPNKQSWKIYGKKSNFDHFWHGQNLPLSRKQCQIVSDISNLGFVSWNWNSHNIKDYDKNSSDPKLVFQNLKIKNNHRLVIGNLNINLISNKFDNLKLIIEGKIDILIITETKTDSTFLLN